MLSSHFRLAAAALSVALVAGCVPPAGTPESGPLAIASYRDIPGWSVDSLSDASLALRTQCDRLNALPPSTELGGQSAGIAYGTRAGEWSAPCRALGATANDDAALRHAIELWFQPYRVTQAALFTGYFEPEVQGSPEHIQGYDTPLLARPLDLIQGPPSPADPNAQPAIGRLADGLIQPYWTRARIEAGASDGTAHTLFWLRSPVDLFFLQVQGSGRVRLPDGSVQRLAFDGRNGRPYTPIGRVLIAQKQLAPEAVTMQSIRAWLEAHPSQAKAVMDANEDYVFFRRLTDADTDHGPPGAMGIRLTPGRSAAIDRHFVPLGAMLFMDTTDPLTGAPWRRLLLAQDRGSDILGAGRTDVFLGAGDAAGARAGAMRQAGTEYLLLPRPPPA